MQNDQQHPRPTDSESTMHSLLEDAEKLLLLLVTG